VNHLKRLGLAAALLAGLATAVGTAPSFAAGSSVAGPQDLQPPPCSTSGSPVATYPGANGLAELDIWWDPAHESNCAEMVHRGAAYGRVALTEVDLYVCAGDTPGQFCETLPQGTPYSASDQGNYSYYAGPVSVLGAGHCIYAVGYFTWSSGSYSIQTSTNDYGTSC
jgi:hypothetical protein